MIDVNNLGEEAVYTFEFISESDLQDNDYIVIKFPDVYDPLIAQDAEFTFLECDSDKVYVPCSSETLGKIRCTVTHWHLRIWEITKTGKAGTAFDISISSVNNPVAGTTDQFYVYHIDSQDKIKAFTKTGGSVSIAASASNGVSFKSVEVSNHEIGEETDFKFEFYLDGTLNKDHVIAFLFPQQYALDLNNKESVSCASVYYDQSGDDDTDQLEALNWVTTSSCEVGSTYIKFSLADGTNQEFSITDKIQVTLKSAVNAQFALERDEEDYWDTKDTDTFGEFSL